MMHVWTIVSGKAAQIAPGKPLRPSTTAGQDVGQRAVPEVVHDLEPECSPFGLLDPKPEHRLVARGVERQGDVDRLVPDEPLVTNLHPQRVEKHDRAAGVQRPGLPLLDPPPGTASLTQLIRSGETSVP